MLNAQIFSSSWLMETRSRGSEVRVNALRRFLIISYCHLLSWVTEGESLIGTMCLKNRKIEWKNSRQPCDNRMEKGYDRILFRALYALLQKKKTVFLVMLHLLNYFETCSICTDALSSFFCTYLHEFLCNYRILRGSIDHHNFIVLSSSHLERFDINDRFGFQFS